MNKWTKALLSAAILFLLAFLPAQAETLSGSGWYYEDTVLTITDNVRDYSLASSKSDWFIGTPFEVNGIDHTTTTIIVEEGVTKLGDLAFYGMGNLTKVVLPSTLTEIGSGTFKACNSLGEITLPASIKTIGHGAFDQCSKLTKITFDGDAPTLDRWDAFYDFSNSYPFVFSGCTANVYYKPYSSWTQSEITRFSSNCYLTWNIVSDASGSCGDNIKWYLVDDTKLYIQGTGPMYDYYSANNVPWSEYRRALTHVEVGNGITRVGNSSFYGGYNDDVLSSIKLPNTLKTIGAEAFYHCDALTSIIIPDSVTSIEHDAFYNCDNLASVKMSANLESLGSSAFSWCYSLESIALPGTLNEGGYYTFCHTTALKNANLSAGMKTIFEEMFCDSGITDIVIPDGVTSIAYGAFRGSSLTSITIPSSVTSIEAAFTQCPEDLVIYCHEDSYAAQYAETNGITTEIEPHALIVLPAVAVSCTADGLTEGSQCSICEKILLAQEVIPTTGHAVITDEAIEETCIASGKTEGSHCVNCGEVFVAQEIIPATGHAEITIEGFAPNCIEPGLMDYIFCETCGEEIQMADEIPALGHKEIISIEALAPNCTEAGYTAEIRCDVCSELIIASAPVPALGHSDYESAAAVAPDCVNTGLTAEISCSVCGNVLAETKIIPALGHTPETDAYVAPDCENTGLTEGSHCSVCGETLSAQEIVPALNHTPVIDPGIPQTDREPGISDGSHCDVCGRVLTTQQPIPANFTFNGDTVIAYNSSAAEVVIPDGVTALDNTLFKNNTFIVSVTVPDSVKSIGIQTFLGCTALENVYLPDNIHTVSTQSFYNTSAKIHASAESATAITLSRHSIPFTTEDGYCLRYRVTSANGTPTAVWCVAYYGNNVDLVLPAEICGIPMTQIQTKAFAACKNLKSITLPDSVTSIAADAFIGSDNAPIILSSIDAYAKTWAESNGYTWKHDQHTESILETVAPTCTETGLTEGMHCSVCGEVLIAQEIVPALGHTEGNCICEICGKVFHEKTWLDENKSCWKCADCGDEFHAYDDELGIGMGKDSCQLCGTLNTCTHENAYSFATYPRSIELVYADTYGHTVYSKVLDDMYCPDCDCAAWTVESDRTNIRENHSYEYGEDTCDEITCNYSKPTDCTHPEDFRTIESREHISSAEAIDAVKHNTMVEVEYEEKCLICSEILDSWMSELVARSDRHYFVDWQTACMYCEYEPSCSHTSLDNHHTNETGYNEDLSTEDTHVRVVHKYRDKVCLECGALVENTEGGIWSKEYIEPHRWHNGKCACGLIMPEDYCEHQDVGSRWAGFEDEKITSISPDLHMREGTAVYEEFCRSCGEVFGLKYIENVQEVSTHASWLNEDGVCEYCNYVPDDSSHNSEACNHQTGEASYEYRIVSGDKETPCTLKYVGMNYCLLCKNSYRTTTLASGIAHESAHTFNGNETVCMFCGYESECEHDNVIHTYHGEPYYVVKDADIHTRYADSWVDESHCDDCGAAIYTEEGLRGIQTADEPHRFVYGICADCGYEKECDHAETEVNVVKQDYIDTYYVEYDDKYHMEVKPSIEETRCVDCGKLVEWQEVEVKCLWAHYFDKWNDYVCYECGAQGSEEEDTYECTHDETSEYSFVLEPIVYAPTENGHRVSYGHYISIECNSCGMEIETRSSDEMTVYEEAHRLDSGAEVTDRCYLCEVPFVYCAHEDTTFVQVEDHGGFLSRVLIPKDENSHVCTMVSPGHRVCNDCHFALSTDMEYYTHSWEQPHEFIGRTCVGCGYTIPCPHEDKEYCGWYIDVELLDVDAFGHNFKGQDICEYYCPDCDSTFTVEGDTDTYRENHYWEEDGSCGREGCTYTRYDCPCLNGDPEKYRLYTYSDPTYMDAGEDGHIITYASGHAECVLCGDGWDTEGGHKVLKPHFLDEEGACWDCGYTPRCSHENTTVEEVVDKWFTDDLIHTMDAHQVNVTTLANTICDDCGACIASEEVEGKVGNEYQPHNWKFGLCECGLAHPGTGCEHEEVKPVRHALDGEDGSIASIDAERHVLDIAFLVRYACADCGMAVDTVDRYEHAREVTYHDFWNHNTGEESDTCSMCGYTREMQDGEYMECEHNHTEYKMHYTEEYDNNSCYMQIYRKSICKDCGDAYDFVELGRLEGDVPAHNYVQGSRVCVSCGYISECSHENVKDDVESIPERYYAVKDAQRHLRWSADWAERVCADCGAGIRAERTLPYRIFTEVEEPHRFSPEGVCFDCGFGCEHTDTEKFVLHPDRPPETEAGWDMNYGFESFERIDVDSHRTSGNALTGIRCETCGTVVESELTPFSYVESHYLLDADSQFCACGEDMSWLQNCTHANTMVDSWYEEVELKEIGADGHVWIVNKVSYEYCAACNAEISSEVVEVNIQQEERHHDAVDDEDILCDDCGWQMTCLHENTHIEEKEILPGICISKDNATHTAYEYKLCVEYCDDCQAEVDTYQKRWIHEENHVIPNGICAKCGHTTDFSYSVSDGRVTITGYMGTGTELEIPAELDGYPVVGIAEYAFSGCEDLVSVVVPEGVTIIGERAFEDCSNLENIQLPDTLTSLGNNVLGNCRKLMNVSIPSGVTVIPDSMFYMCSGLQAVELHEGITVIEPRAFFDCESLESIELPKSLTRIGFMAFNGCYKLPNITIPKGITVIEHDAFNSCRSLTSIEVPEGVTTIEYYAFIGCQGLQEISIPDSVTSIGVMAFAHCESLTEIILPDKLTKLEELAFMNCANLKSVTVPESVTEIGDDAFIDCPKVIVTVKMNSYAHNWCIDNDVACNPVGIPSENAWILPAQLTKIEDDAFLNLPMQEVVISDQVVSIGSHAFAGCGQLQYIFIPDSVTEIGEGAFDGCENVIFICASDNYAANYARDKGIKRYIGYSR